MIEICIISESIKKGKDLEAAWKRIINCKDKAFFSVVSRKSVSNCTCDGVRADIVIIDCERCKEVDGYIRIITASKKKPEIIDVKTAYDTWKRMNKVAH